MPPCYGSRRGQKRAARRWRGGLPQALEAEGVVGSVGAALRDNPRPPPSPANLRPAGIASIPRHGDATVTAARPDPAPLTDADIAHLAALLDSLPPPCQPLDVSALDGYLCGVLLQPKTVPAARWRARIADLEGRAAPAGAALDEALALAERRHGELDRAIGARQWFDPWVFPPDDDADEAAPSQALLPWVAGFAAALEAFGDLLALGDPALIEPMALLYAHFDPDDLEDADALLEVIDTLEPPADLAEAVQDCVRAVMLLADVTRPRRLPATRRAPPRRPRR
ncbi:MAG: YecA family protein [Burkholderiales bacterium]|nr:YecA family protein [Burkholderiales bacterium]